MALNSSQGTLGDASPAIGDFPANHAFFVKEFIEIAAPILVYDMFGTPRGIPRNNSNQIVFNRVDKLATLENAPLTEGTTPPEQQFQLARITQTVDQFGGFATTTDRLQEESINGLTSQFNTRICDAGTTETTGLPTGSFLSLSRFCHVNFA